MAQLRPPRRLRVLLVALPPDLPLQNRLLVAHLLGQLLACLLVWLYGCGVEMVCNDTDIASYSTCYTHPVDEPLPDPLALLEARLLRLPPRPLASVLGLHLGGDLSSTWNDVSGQPSQWRGGALNK